MKKILTKGIVALFALVFVMTFAFAIGQLTFGNSTEGTAYADGTTVDLSTLTSGYTAQDGDTLTGTLGGNYQISIADGAHVTLNGVTINGVNSNEYAWAGLNLAGSATLILSGDNTVVGFHENYPGIFVPENKTLTISGEGTLIARSNGYGAGIGGGAFSDLAGGNIVIENGTITAYGGANGGAGIGSGYCGTCGDITITGGIITAEGGSGAAGIGGGAQEASCGTITIESTVAALSATLGGNSPTSIGQGVNGTCGTVTIRGEEGAITDRTYVFVTATADDVIALINEIGEVEYTEESKEKIVKARRYYDLLSTEEQAKVGDSLATLEAAENTYIELHDTATATETTETITNLPSIENITLDDKDAVAAARAAYDELSDEAKAKVSKETLDKLVAAEKEIDDIETSTEVTETINALPATDEIKPEDKQAIAEARKAFEELSDEAKKKVSKEMLEKLDAAELTLAVVTVDEQLETLPESYDNITAERNKEAIVAAREAYEKLSEEQKAKFPKEKLERLEQAETALAFATINEELANLPEDLDDITLDDKDSIEAAKATYEALSDEEKQQVPQATLEKLEEAVSVLEVVIVDDEIEKLPSTDKITLDSKDAIVEAREAYEALTDGQKAKVPVETVSKLEAAEKEIVDIETSNAVDTKIDNLPAVEDMTILNRTSVRAAKAAYDALSPEAKAKVPAETVAKLEAAIQEIADIETANAAEKSIDVVSDTDELTLADESAVQAARAAYEALTPNQKSKLPSDTLAALQEAEAVIAEIKTINVTDGEVKSYSKEIETGSADGTDVSVLFNQAAKDDSTSKEVQIKSGDTTVVFDANAVKQIGGNDVTFSVSLIDNPDVEGAVFGIDLTLKGSTFQFGKATVSTAFNKNVPFGKKAVVYYVAYNGELVKMNTWLENGVLSFETNHFSPYVVKYELTGGSIAGIVIGCVIGFALIILLIILLVKLLKKRNKKDEEPKKDEPKKDDNDEVSEDAKDYVCIADEGSATAGEDIADEPVQTEEAEQGDEVPATAGEDSADELVEESEEETEDEVPAEEEKTPAEEEAQAEEAEQGDEVPATAGEDSAEEPEQAEEAEQEDEVPATAGEDSADEPLEESEEETEDEVPAEEPVAVEEPVEEEPKEEPITLKQSMAVAKTATHNTTWNKASIAKYLADKHGEEVEINERENFTSTGLPLADTHYAKDEDTRKCFVYVYETEGAPMLLINTDKELAKELAKRHSNVHKSAFPKSKDNWYSLPLDDSYSDEDVKYILDRCHANALGRDWDEQELSLKESLALAKSAKAEKTTHTTSKNSICEYLASKYGDEVALNTRDNYTRTGLPLADTHYVHGEDGKDRCFVYVYETQGSMMLLVRANYNFAKALKKNHPNVHKSAFPKSKEPWNSIILDDSFSDEEVHKLLDDVIALNK